MYLTRMANILVKNRPTPEDFMFINNDYQSKIDLCFNFRNHPTPTLLFDLQRTNSDFDWDNYGINPEYATMLMILINGDRDTVLLASDISTNAQTYRLDLRAYGGESPEVTLIPYTLLANIDSTSNDIQLTGDNIIFDNFRLDLTTSTTDLSLSQDYTLSPNPSTDRFVLTKEAGADLSGAILRLVDVSGKLISEQRIQQSLRQFEFGEALHPGMYFLQVVHGDESGYFKLLKQ